MTNQYVPDLGQLGSGDIARSSDVNDRYENTVAGFDRLPTPKNGEQGFSVPVPVGEPTNSDHAATKNFVETGVTSQVNIAEGHKDAAAASEAAALISEQNADASEAVALAQAGVATTKANEASTSASEALASENLASASETAALASENAAFASETAAASSESAADLDRIAAQAARVGAEAALDSFDDRYLGAKAADPTLDNDGNGLLTGALYFDTNTAKMKVYDGSLWEPAYVPPSLLTFQTVTDTGGTTTNSISVSGLTASNADVNFTGLASSSSTTDPVVVINSSGRIEKKTLGTNAYNSDTYDNYQGWQLNGGSSTQAISKNETVTFIGSGGTTVSNSENTVTINSVDTNTTNFNLQVNSGTATNISAGETINYTGSSGISVSRIGNSITIDGAGAGITDIVSDTTPQLGANLDANGFLVDMGVNTITDTKVGQWDVAYGDKVNTVGFDTGSGILTLNRQDGGAVTKDLDGRYPLNNGTGASGTWAINISGNAVTATTAGSCTGNSATATWADTVDVNSGNNANAWYDVVWHSGDTVYSTAGVEIHPLNNKVRATAFVGALEGNATSATNARVTADSAGNRALVLCTADGTTRDETLYKDAGASTYFNTSNNTLVCPTFSGALAGNATTATSCTGNAATASQVSHYPNRADSAIYPVIWGTATSTTHAYSCAAVNIQSSTGTLYATTFSGALSGNATSATASSTVYVNDYSGSTTMRILGSHNGSNSQGNVYKSAGIYAKMNTNTLYATTFSGALSGNATSATTATTAGTCTGNAATATTATNVTGITRNVGDYGSISANTTRGGYYGLSCNGHLVMMSNGSAHGIFDDVNNKWWMRFHENAQVEMNYNGTARVTTTNAGATVTGALTATGNVTAYSDERLKSDIETLDGSKVYDMRGVSYTKDGEASSGVIAQELQKVAPELVHEGEEYLSVSYGNLVGYLIEAVKDLKAEIEELKGAK